MVRKDASQVIGDEDGVSTGETETKTKQDGMVKEKAEQVVGRLGEGWVLRAFLKEVSIGGV